MATRKKESKAREGASRRTPRKDRLIQTRVPEDLESTLKEEAARRRLTVSHLIRSVLEDTFHLVDDVVNDLDKVVTGSVDLARNVSRNAQRIASTAQLSESEPRPNWDEGLDDVYGWNEVVLQRAATCVRCEAKLAKGSRGYVGLSDQPRKRKPWLCGDCVAAV